MNKIMNNVLLLDGGGTQTLPIAKSLHQKSHSVHIFFEHKLSYGFGTRYASRRIQSLPIREESAYLDFFKDYVLKNSIDVVIPMSDPSALFLSKNKEEFSKLCHYISPDIQTFMRGYDKNMLMNVCRENGYPHPKTIDLSVINISDVEDSFFPAILKPNLTTGGRGMKILDRKKDLELVYEKNLKEYGRCHLQKLVASGGKQFKVELFFDENHMLVNSSVIHKQRFYPVSGGSSCFNVTVLNEPIVDLCTSVLKKIGWIGFADFDLIEDPKDGIIKIMEINPRIPACIKSAIESGIDYANIIVDASMGREIGKYEYHPGKQLRHIGFDILWFLNCKERFRSETNWFNFFDKNQYFQDFSIRDPLPFVYGTLGNIKKVSNQNFRKSKNKTQLT
jgi:predicted ATP-grasp superfamily ATP-dependent carboligase